MPNYGLDNLSLMASEQGEDINRECAPSHPQTPTKPVLRKENWGGYDCEFVERPSDNAQGGECPVCLLVLKEPCLTSCCGHKYCRVCMERVKKDTKPCPLCNEPDFSFFQERALERYLKDLDVWCCYKKVGCEWRGKLAKYEQHLNKTPSPESQVIGCQFVEVECMYECGEWFQRQHITTHQTQECNKRPYSCDYCRDYSSTFEEVIKIHYPQCNKYPVDCPNKCREYPFERQELATHLKDECPLTLVNCPFYYAGCDVQIPRKDISEHMKDLTKHLTLLASVTHTIMKENQDLRETMKKMNQGHQDKMKAMQDEMEEKLQATQQDMLQATQQGVQEKLQATQQDVQKKLQATQQGVQEKLQATQQSVQEKLQATQQDVQKKLQATQQGVQEKLQATQQDVQKKLQATQQDVQKKLQATQQGVQEKLQATQQDVQEKLQVTQQGVQAMQEQVQTTQESVKATEDGTENLTEKIEELKLAMTRYAGFPKVYRVERTESELFMPGFYTHHNGYKMCISVDPNGHGDGEGTHISIYTHLVKGLYDDHLKWPFRGIITIQIVNQAGDHDHIEHTIPYKDETQDDSTAGRVTREERSEGWGEHQFLAHSNLEYNAIKKTQYLKDNHFIVRVVKIELM